VDDGIWYTIENREQNRHHLQYPMSAIEVMITHYTLNSAKFILDKMAIPSSAYRYKKIILQRVDNTHSTITVMYNLVHSTMPVTHIAVTCRPLPTNRCNRSPRAMSRRPANSINDFLSLTALRGVCHRCLKIQGGVSPASPISSYPWEQRHSKPSASAPRDDTDPIQLCYLERRTGEQVGRSPSCVGETAEQLVTNTAAPSPRSQNSMQKGSDGNHYTDHSKCMSEGMDQ
jgi:hypothetical protein